MNSSEAVHVLKGHTDALNGIIAFLDALGHTMLASCSGVKTIRIWDPIRGGEAIRVLECHSSSDVSSVTAFMNTMDQAWAVRWSVDRTVRIWDSIKGGEAARMLESHSEALRA